MVLASMTYDAIVIGAGFAGLSAAVRLARHGAKVIVLEARSRLGGRATAFNDRETGELVDNGQHVLLGCYRETLAFLDHIGARENVSFQPTLGVTMVDRRGVRSRLDLPALPPPLHLVAGVFDWEALAWKDRLAVLRMRTPLRIARRGLERGAHAIAASPGETVENWLIRNGQTARLREMLWDPLALAALNQSPSHAAAPPFVRVLAEMFGPDPKAAAIGVPNKPLDAMYAEPARAFLERRGGVVRTGAPAKVALTGDRLLHVSSGPDRFVAPVVVSAVPWFALPDLFDGNHDALQSEVARARANRDGQPVAGHGDLRRAVRRPAGARDAVGLRQAAGVRRVGVTPVARLERRGGSHGSSERRADRNGARRGRRGLSAGADGAAVARHGDSRAAGDLLAGAGTAAAAGHGDTGARAISRRRLD
jgi:predicted NAD/FAD-binding protein